MSHPKRHHRPTIDSLHPAVRAEYAAVFRELDKALETTPSIDRETLALAADVVQDAIDLDALYREADRRGLALE